jgi:hypothetical protein
MSPVWLIEGGATATDPIFNAEAAIADAADSEERPGVTRRRFSPAERRFSELAAAVRDHESTGRHQAMPARPQDLALYRRLRQICGDR